MHITIDNKMACIYMHKLAKVINSFNIHVLKRQMTREHISKHNMIILGGLGLSAVVLENMGVPTQFKNIF